MTAWPDRRARRLLVCLVLFGAALRVVASANKNTMTNDEGWSYLVAACNEGQYYSSVVSGNAPPYGTWSTAATWISFTQPTARACFRTIAEDLATWDVHPPLYFWLLHVVVLVLGTAMWVGPLINVFLDSLSAWLLYGIGKRVFSSETAALSAVFLWLMSPAVIAASWEARSYPLLALLALWALRVTLDVAEQARLPFRRLVELGLVTALGLLTHHYFLIWTSGCLLVLTWSKRHTPRHVLGIWSAGLVGIALFVLLFPWSLTSVASRASTLSGHGIEERIVKTAGALSGFVTQYARLSGPSGYAMAAAFVGVGLVLLISRRQTPPEAEAAGAKTLRSVVGFMGLWVAAGVSGSYILGFAPVHAMGNKYLSLVWPFAALGMTALFARSIRYVPLVALGAVVSLSGLEFATREARWGPGNDALLRSVDDVIIDTVHPGIMLRTTFYLSPAQRVLAADQRFLIDNAHLVSARRADTALFLASRSYRNTLAFEEDLVRQLRLEDDVSDLQTSLNGTGRLYSLRRPAADAKPQQVR